MLENFARIERLYAWIAHEKDGTQGICGALTEGGHWRQLCSPDEKLMRTYAPPMQRVSKARGVEITLVVFDRRGEGGVLQRFLPNDA